MAVMDRAFVESGKGKVKKDEARQGWVKSEPAEWRECLVNKIILIVILFTVQVVHPDLTTMILVRC